MQIARMDEDLALLIPMDVAEEIGLKEGDDVLVDAVIPSDAEVEQSKMTPVQAMRRLGKIRITLAPESPTEK